MHAEILRSDQELALKRLGNSASESGFYLAGGTALAIHLGHRRSDDFDWFTQGLIDDPQVLERNLQARGLTLTEQQVSPGTLHAVLDSVHVSFLEYRYPLLKPLINWRDYDCKLADVPDICCMKLAAIAHRGARKDFVDIYSIAQSTGLSLPQMLDLYREKYNTDEVVSVVYGLSYFEDAEEDLMPEMLRHVSWVDIKREVSAWVANYR
jgi:hypothetical protein